MSFLVWNGTKAINQYISFFMLNDYLPIKQACSRVFDERPRPIYIENE